MVVVDGDHHPDVTEAAIANLGGVVAAVIIGGGEKAAADFHLGVPVTDDFRAGLESFAPDQVVELSDEPVLTDRGRFDLASIALANGVGWRGGGWSVEPPPRPHLTDMPSIAVIATAKRAGKTALSASVARRAKERGRNPVIVAMSRGGPSQPEVIDPASTDLSAAGLLARADNGDHAASDHIEGALCAGVPSVGTRRCGSGIAGAPTFANYVAGVLRAQGLGDLLLLERSGSAIPPCAADATLLVVPSSSDPEHFSDYLNPMRVLIADAVAITMASESGAESARSLDLLELEITRVDPMIPVLRTLFRPYPLEPIAGSRVFLTTTAPAVGQDGLVDDLESRWGAQVVAVSHHLAEREKLRADLVDGAAGADVIVTELKAAGVDVAARFALETGKRVVFCDHRAELVEGSPLDHHLDALIDRATARTL